MWDAIALDTDPPANMWNAPVNRRKKRNARRDAAYDDPEDFRKLNAAWNPRRLFHNEHDNFSKREQRQWLNRIDRTAALMGADGLDFIIRENDDPWADPYIPPRQAEFFAARGIDPRWN